MFMINNIIAIEIFTKVFKSLTSQTNGAPFERLWARLLECRRLPNVTSEEPLMHLSVVCPTYHTWVLMGGVGGELTSNTTSSHTWGTNLHTVPLHIPYKYPISPCCAKCVIGYLWNSQKLFRRYLTQQRRIRVDWSNPDKAPTSQERFQWQISLLSPTLLHMKPA